MKKTAAPIEAPYADGTDAADMVVLSKAVAERMHALMLDVDPAWIRAVAGDSGKLIIVQGSGDPALKALSGDITVDAAGIVTIGNEKVNTVRLLNLAVTAAKIAAEAIETGKIQNLAVTEAKLAALAVSTGKLANLSVTTEKLANEAVTNAKVANNTLTPSKMSVEMEQQYQNTGAGEKEVGPVAEVVTLPFEGKGQSYILTGAGTTKTITNPAVGSQGRIIVVRIKETATLKDGTGNLRLASDLVGTPDDTITLMSAQTVWFELCRSIN